MSDINCIKHLRNTKGLSISEIQKTLGINWRTAKKYADEDQLPEEKQTKKTGMMYEEKWGEIVSGWLFEDRRLKRKLRRNKKQIFEELKAHGSRVLTARSVTSSTTGGTATVQKTVRIKAMNVWNIRRLRPRGGGGTLITIARSQYLGCGYRKVANLNLKFTILFYLDYQMINKALNEELNIWYPKEFMLEKVFNGDI